MPWVAKASGLNGFIARLFPLPPWPAARLSGAADQVNSRLSLSTRRVVGGRCDRGAADPIARPARRWRQRSAGCALLAAEGPHEARADLDVGAARNGRVRFAQPVGMSAHANVEAQGSLRLVGSATR